MTATALSLLINALIQQSSILVAFSEAAPDEILGWMSFGDSHVNYVYVKHPFRRLGIGTKLLRGMRPEATYTFKTRAGEKLAAKHKLVFYPVLLSVK